ncbi:helix-turn-helix domain-containing protein [Kibdelosporangium aridum]|uniref:helix-turn-helix domain-containing protein n=1 Tax=Kibdelosporangium aridum TaxID=2030 RepID=UPI0035ECE0EC
MTDEPMGPSIHDFEAESTDDDGPLRRRAGQEGDYLSQHSDALVDSLVGLTDAIRDLVARSPMSSEELLTAEQLGELFRLSSRTLRDLAAAGLVPHHRIGKHYRFSRDDVAEILQATKQVLKARQTRRRAA